MYKIIKKNRSVLLVICQFLLVLTACNSGPVLLGPDSTTANPLNGSAPDNVDQNQAHNHSLEIVSTYLNNFKTPGCDAANPEVLIISDDSDWQHVNSSDYRIFCVKPGHYSDIGTIELTTSGTESNPRIILLESAETPEHPAKLEESAQAIIQSITLKSASHWIISRLSILDTPDNATAVIIDSGSSFNTLDQMRIERFYYGLNIDNGAHGNTIQRSLIGNIRVRRGSDTVCIGLLGYRTRPESIRILDTKIVNNEIYNCNDGIQAIINPQVRYAPDFSGLVIDGNDIYLTPKMYSNCSGTRDPTGDCACAENAIDLKAGAADPANPVLITNNRLWGMRKTDLQCGGSGSWGEAIVGSFQTKNVQISQNVIFDAARGISLSTGPTNLLVSDNLIHGINSTNDNEGLALSTTADSSNLTFSRNTVVDATAWLVLQSPNSAVECNILIDSGSARGVARSGTVIDRNSYFNTPEWASSSGENVVYGLDSDSANDDYCFTVKRISGREDVCLPYGKRTDASPVHTCSIAN